MGSLWRSEKMELAELFIQSEVRHTSSNALRVLQGGLPAFPVTHTHTLSPSFLSPFYILQSLPSPCISRAVVWIIM